MSRAVAPEPTGAAFSADTSTALLPCALALPSVAIPLCCCNYDGIAEGPGEGCSELALFFCCWYQHVGEWTGLFDLSNRVKFELSEARGLVVEDKNYRSSFPMANVEMVGLFSSVCAHQIVGAKVEGVCYSSAMLVQVFSDPLLALSATEARRGLPSLVDCCADPILNACAKAYCANAACCCGTAMPKKGSFTLKRVNCAFLGAVVKDVGVVRLSQKAWRASSVSKLAAVVSAIHSRFPHLTTAAEAGKRAGVAPAPLKMEKNDRMRARPSEDGITGIAGSMSIAN
jgi:hypothetical protein